MVMCSWGFGSITRPDAGTRPVAGTRPDAGTRPVAGTRPDAADRLAVLFFGMSLFILIV